MNYFTRLSDSLFNLISGLGTAKDPTSAARFRLHLLDRNTVEEMYRSDWVSRKIVDAPAEDATREWRQWEGDKEELGAIQGTEDKHKIQMKMRQALIRARLYGGAALVFAIKGQDPAEELDHESVGKGDLDFVVVMNRYELMAGPRIFNVESPWYTRPEYYTVATPVFGFTGERGNQYPTPEVNRPSAIATTPGAGTGRSVAPESVQTMAATGHSDPRRQMTPPIMGTVKVHPSRVIEFTGNELPDWRLVPMGGGWGDSILQTVDEVLKDIGLVIGGIANMVNDAKVDVIKIPDFSKQIATSEYANRLLARFSYANQAKSTVNSILLDTDEEWQRVQSNFGSLPNILHEYLVLAGGAADIPMSRLIGQTGGRGMQGMSSGGDSGGGNDLRNYYDRIAARQKTIYTPAMQPLDICIVRDALGKYDSTYTYEWNPLWQMDDETKAKVAVDKATAVKHDVEMGLINEDVLRQTRIAQLIEDGFYPGLEDAVDEFGAEPEEPDIEVPWSRLAGAMQALGGPQPPQSGGNGNGGNGGGNGNGGGGNAPRGRGNGNGGGGGNATALAGTVPYSKVQNYLTETKDADQVTKSSVNYRDAPEGAEQRCGNCSMYHDHACTLVRGLIDPQDVCDRWEAKAAHDAGPDDEPRVPAGSSEGGEWTSGGEGRRGKSEPATMLSANENEQLKRFGSASQGWKDKKEYDALRTSKQFAETLQKLPRKTGTFHRGMVLGTQEEIDQFQVGRTITMTKNSFATSDSAWAKSFAELQISLAKNKGTPVVLHVKNGEAAATAKNRKEVVWGIGTKIKVNSVRAARINGINGFNISAEQI